MLSKHAKLFDYRVFEVDNYKIECRVYETRYSWGHYATLFENGHYIGDLKYTYYNRTWESYKYQSIIHGILSKYLKEQGEGLYQQFDDIGNGNVNKELGFLATVAKLGDVLGNNQKESNDWKARMLKAGTGDAITLPDDWDTLTEDEKAKRLDGAIGILG